MSRSTGGATAEDIAPSLPASAGIRWHASHKAALIIAIRAGTITFSEACERYCLSYEELSTWETAFDQDGMAALQVKYAYARLKQTG